MWFRERNIRCRNKCCNVNSLLIRVFFLQSGLNEPLGDSSFDLFLGIGYFIRLINLRRLKIDAVTAVWAVYINKRHLFFLFLVQRTSKTSTLPRIFRWINEKNILTRNFNTTILVLNKTWSRFFNMLAENSFAIVWPEWLSQFFWAHWKDGVWNLKKA